MGRYQSFTLQSIYKMKQLRETFDELLKTLCRDCLDRPGETKPRELVLKLQMKPDAADSDNLIVSPVLSAKMPSRKQDAYKMTTSVQGDLRFQPNFPMDPHQQDLFDDGDDAE